MGAKDIRKVLNLLELLDMSDRSGDERLHGWKQKASAFTEGLMSVLYDRVNDDGVQDDLPNALAVFQNKSSSLEQCRAAWSVVMNLIGTYDSYIDAVADDVFEEAEELGAEIG